MSHPSIEQVLQGPTIALVVQDRKAVARDLRLNGKRALRTLIALMGYCLVSAIVTTAAETDHGCDHCFKGALPERFGDAVYYTWINVTTVGFGDFSPQSIIGKVVAGINALVGLLFIGWTVAILATSLTPSGGANQEFNSPHNAGRLARFGRWLSKKFRGFGRWLTGWTGQTRPTSETFLNVTVRDVEVARLSEELASSQGEVAHLKDALVRERGIVDDLVLGRGDRDFRPGGQRALDDLNFSIRDFLFKFKLIGMDGMSRPVVREEVRCVPERNAVIVVLHPFEPDLSKESSTEPSSGNGSGENPDDSLEQAYNRACRRVMEDKLRLESWQRMRAQATSPGHSRILDEAISLSAARLKLSETEASEVGKRLAERSAEGLNSVLPAAPLAPRDGGGRL